MEEKKYKSILIRFVNGDQEIFNSCKDITLGKKLVKFKSCEEIFTDDSGKFIHADVMIYKDQILFIKTVDEH